MINLERVKRTEKQILADMAVHYSQPKGFVGRNQCYAVLWCGKRYGSIVSGSATRHLPGRNDWLGRSPSLNEGVNNIFFHLHSGKYPCRNFAQKVISVWRKRAQTDWADQYGDAVAWFETLVELPRTGELYRRDGWEPVGQTKGFTCKRVAGKGTDDWSGKRVWDTENLRPKLVLVRHSEQTL